MRAMLQTILMIGLAAGIASGQGGPPPANVRLDMVRLEQLAEHRAVTGTIVARRRATLAGQHAGLVIELNVEAGDRVEQGTVLARLDDEIMAREADRAEALVQSAQAVVSRRQAEVTEAMSDLGRAEELVREGSASAGELEAAQTRVQVAQAQLLEAQAEVLSEQADHRAAAKRLQDMHIVAPFAGTVVTKRTEVGEWLGLGDPVIELVADDLLEALIDVPEEVVGRLQIDEPVSIRIRALGVSVEGRILGVVPEAEELSRMFRVRIEVPSRVAAEVLGNEDGDDLTVRPGMSVTAMVPTSQSRPMLTILKDAIKRGVAGEFVYYDNGGVSGIAQITQLFALGDRVAIRSSTLEEGTRVVVQGNERLSVGQPLNELDDRTTDSASTEAPVAEGEPAATPDQGG